MFRTELPLIPAPQQLPLSARVLTIGSCFSDTIGARLAEAKIHALANPFGTVFNPISACKLLRAAAGEDTDWQQHVVEARGRWQSYDLHATLGANSPVDLLQTLQQVLRDTGVFLATADTVILTLGSAWVYRLKETDELVSNCHKMPGEKFDKELLTPDEIINAVAETHAYLRLRNPKLRFVLTVSPVRHLKDTLPLNAVSKSVLRVACHYLSELLPDVSYFPAYELLLDDLRDYRFYAADMLHPSPVAEDYIWERFARTYFDADFGRFRKEWDSVRQALNHRPLHEAAPEHRQFLVSTLERLEKLAGRADMRMEILDVRKRLENLPLPKPVPVPEPEDDDEERIDVGDDSSKEPLTTAEPVRQPEPVEPISHGEIEPEGQVSEAESLAEAMEETAQPKKKRRSRGGAKRNKKKHAARLAEEAAAANSAIVSEEATATPLETQPATNENGAAVTVLLDPEAPLQTALERRKRASRRNRGRKQGSGDTEIAAPSSVVDTVSVTEEPMPTTDVELTAGEAVTADASATPLAEQESATEPVVSATPLPNAQRPPRTGRSASEVRAAALRKPRRPDSRIKTLYATPPAPQEEQPEAVVSTTEPSDTPPTPITAVSTPAEPQSPPSATITTPVEPVRLPVASAIPPVQGTGASGRLSASGQATLRTGNARSAISAPQAEAQPTVPADNPVPAIAPQQPAGTATASAPDTAVPESLPEGMAEPAPVSVPIASAPKKAKPANRKPKQEATPVAKPTSDKAKPKARKTVAKPKEAAPTPEVSATDTPAASAARRRKAVAKPAAAPEPPAEKPKRPSRPSRRKPAAPDETADAS
ncbi:GSCFA domain-containing protein [Hymenobacter sp. BT186]|uniref:GSCFA domain-containing protein n=1 Tax=Hymenobacter telluris TaxID=2816474 RepID=A0A939EXA6_9BACT|nr:GSCFA domain-containing protein [Hymenobacter telluris]MBO0358746.1 GSCFA domain-containing protein [Hymenobacter telluris]MBW3374772.1 GSCFA domain-containing protein [Hymenobacter norwichensis]